MGFFILYPISKSSTSSLSRRISLPRPKRLEKAGPGEHACLPAESASRRRDFIKKPHSKEMGFFIFRATDNQAIYPGCPKVQCIKHTK